jgi:hypothetical protein
VAGTLSSNTVSKINAGDVHWPTLHGGKATLNVVCTHLAGDDDDSGAVCAIETGTHFTAALNPPTAAPASRPTKMPAPRPTTAPARLAPSSAPTRAPTKGPAMTAAAPPLSQPSAAPPLGKAKGTRSSDASSASSTVLAVLVTAGLGSFLGLAWRFAASREASAAARKGGRPSLGLSGDDELELFEMPREKGRRPNQNDDDDDDDDNAGTQGRGVGRPTPYRDTDSGGAPRSVRGPQSLSGALPPRQVPKGAAATSNPLDAMRADTKNGGSAAHKEDIEIADLLDFSFDGEGVDM